MIKYLTAMNTKAGPEHKKDVVNLLVKRMGK
jgi:hypothetical protein